MESTEKEKTKENQVSMNDFVEIEYTGKTAQEQIVFDTTYEKTAKENDLFREGVKYGGIIICIGHKHVVQGLDEALVEKEIGKQFNVTIPSDKAFGKKTGKLLQLIATNKFLKDQIQPMPGLQVNVDGNIGVIKTVTGGRTLVDFNHPLAGKDVIYTCSIKRKVDNTEEKVKGLLQLTLQINDTKIKIDGKKVVITLEEELPKEIVEHINQQFKLIIPEIEEFVFVSLKTNKQ
ncbi:FKBP-type peptidyl-prolyl cis-trans isomerase [Candidatus Woesearchaeota archaeon]|nr:FKBP-type peptidyl-prolyl cis-trans isomerase [Candidatus Woesearchaeota archaeon]